VSNCAEGHANTNHRVLVVDDDPSAQADFARILGGRGAFVQPELFGPVRRFEITSASAGDEAALRVRESASAGRPFAVAFVDARGPTVWGGLDSAATIECLWREDPRLHAVLCTADAERSWDDVIARLGRLGHGDRLLILKKPLDAIEVRQIARALSEKWSAEEREKLRLEEARACASSLMTINRALESARAAAVAAAAAAAAGGAKSEFLAGMTHAIRSAVLAILGHAELLGDGGSSEDERREHLHVIRNQGARLLSMLPDVLDIAAIETDDPVSEERAGAACGDGIAKEPDAQALRGRVLLVEDERATQRLYSLYLRRAGAEVDVADNGQIAVDRVLASMNEGRPYDLVLMDMQMPVLDGFSATRILRESRFAGPIIAVTAQALAGDRERCLSAGCDDFCAKPADREHLVRLSREWIQKSVPPALPRPFTDATRPTPTRAT
jgi:CheY-like chemotaxis protein